MEKDLTFTQVYEEKKKRLIFCVLSLTLLIRIICFLLLLLICHPVKFHLLMKIMISG